jgi:hypothetical protein
VPNGPSLASIFSWPNQKNVTVNGLYFVQETSPAEIGAALADFRAGPARTLISSTNC